MPNTSPPPSNPPLSSASFAGVMMCDTPIIFAFEIMGDGAGREIFGDELSQSLAHNRSAWVYLDANHADTATWLASEISYLDDIVIEALLDEETRPRFVPVNDGVLLILRGVNLNANADPEDMVSIQIFIDLQRVVSVQKRPLRAAADIRSKLIKGEMADG